MKHKTQIDDDANSRIIDQAGHADKFAVARLVMEDEQNVCKLEHGLLQSESKKDQYAVRPIVMHSLLSDVVFLSKKHPLKKATVGNKLEVQLMDAYCAAKGTPSEIAHKKDGISGK